LSDPEKRKKYDEYGEHWKHADEFEAQKQRYQQQQGGKGFSGGYWSAADGSFSDNEGEFSDFFESLFGSRHGNKRSYTNGFKGQDYNAELHLSLKNAASTHKQILEVNGKKIRITVPAGISNGQTIKLNGQGGPGMNGGPAGDLYITFVIADDPVYKRQGDNLYMNLEVDLYTAVLGGEVTVETLNGKVKLKVKPETQNGSKVRLKGKGFPVYKQDGIFGDLFVTYEIKIPTHLTDKQKKLFQELRDA
ncbi:MAG: J domain-containing protein, partial [Odoribacter sp.]|nr:J domain-containing protein [Odoribacter sp.]